MSAKVLVADDSATMRKIIIRSLNALGVTDIIEAEDGTRAWELFQASPSDLVLTDWNMPGKTGLEVVQAIRTAGSKVPVVLVTTEAERERILQALQAGASDYLVKPFQVDDLRRKLEKHLALTT